MNGTLLSSLVIKADAASVNSHKRTMWTLVAINCDMTWEKAEDTYRSIILTEKIETTQAPRWMPVLDREVQAISIEQLPMSQGQLVHTSLPAPSHRYHMNTNSVLANPWNHITPKDPPPIRRPPPPPPCSVIQLPRLPSMDAANFRTSGNSVTTGTLPTPLIIQNSRYDFGLGYAARLKSPPKLDPKTL